MKKRLRKKKRFGEFQEFGFPAGFRFSNELNVETRNGLIDRFYVKAIEENGLEFGGGGGGNEWTGFTALDQPRGSTTETHRHAVERWFIQEPLVLEYYVALLKDAWHGNFERFELEWIRKEMA
jgi:uncharacterized protein